MLNQATISESLPRLQKGEISARELMQSCLDRIERTDKDVRAFLHVDAADALAQADAADAARKSGDTLGKPLLGIPIAMKDVIAAGAGIEEATYLAVFFERAVQAGVCTPA